MDNRCAFVIPVYNHATRLAGVLEGVLTFGLPVFVVDDGSTDGSAGVASRFDRVTVLRHDHNHGKGAALQTGFRAAAEVANWAVTLDADGQHEPGDTPRLLAARPSGTRAIVIGRREDMQGRHVPWTSRFGRKFSNFWVRASGGGRLRDSQSGFRLYPLPEILGFRTYANRFQYEIEVLALAGWHGLRVIEVPVRVHYQPKGERVSHFRPWVDFWRNAATFSRLIFRRILVPRRLRVRRSTRAPRHEQEK